MEVMMRLNTAPILGACGKDNKHDYGNKNKNKCILYQTLTFACDNIYLLSDLYSMYYKEIKRIEQIVFQT